MERESAHHDHNGRLRRASFKKRNNLPIEPNATYNYDRERQKDEGNDWP